MIVLMVLAALFAGVIAPYDPIAINQRLQFRPPSREHWVGTDEFGRDLFSRIIYGARRDLHAAISRSLQQAVKRQLLCSFAPVSGNI